jgi:hypothetical protein
LAEEGFRIEDCVIRHNVGEGATAGIIVALDLPPDLPSDVADEVVILRTDIVENAAPNKGVALAARLRRATFVNCSIVGNRPPVNDPALVHTIIVHGQSRRLRLWNSLVANNQSLGCQGTAILVLTGAHSDESEVEVVNSTVANNTNLAGAPGGGSSLAAERR